MLPCPLNLDAVNALANNDEDQGSPEEGPHGSFHNTQHTTHITHHTTRRTLLTHPFSFFFFLFVLRPLLLVGSILTDADRSSFIDPDYESLRDIQF